MIARTSVLTKRISELAKALRSIKIQKFEYVEGCLNLRPWHTVAEILRRIIFMLFLLPTANDTPWKLSVVDVVVAMGISNLPFIEVLLSQLTSCVPSNKDLPWSTSRVDASPLA